MKSWVKISILIFCLAEISAGAVIGRQIYQRRQRVLGAQFVVKLEKDRYIYHPSGPFSLFYEPAPNGTWVDREFWLPGEVRYTINADGLNERFNYSVQKPAGTFRVMTLGDSFTFGVFVNTKENYSEVLEDTLNKERVCGGTAMEVMNLGVNGYDIGYAAQRFISRGAKYNPDLVIWFINPHNMVELRDLITAREKEIQASMSAQDQKYYESQGDYYHATSQALRDLSATMSQDVILASQSSYFKRFADSYHRRLLIVDNNVSGNPAFEAVIDAFTAGRPDTWVERDMPVFSKIGGSLPDGHPNVYGHSVIASHIASYLKTQQILPCQK